MTCTALPPPPLLSPGKRKTIVWNEANLMFNETNKSAKMTIDEIDTPWASPPRELFEDPMDEGGVDGEKKAEKSEKDMDDVANRLRDIDTAGGLSGGVSGGDAGAVAAPQTSGGGVSGQKIDTKSEWDSSDDESAEHNDGKQKQKLPKLSFPREALDGDEYGEPEDFAADTDQDRELKQRLFEAQRKSHQCTFRGVLAKGKALLEGDGDE